MASKTLETLLIVIVCLLLFPLGIGIIGGFFGAVVGVIGAIFGAIAGIIGGIFGAVVGLFGWLFNGLFGGICHFGFFHWNTATIAVLVILIVLLTRNKRGKK